eukprot:XP_011447957.1 PREDICTED: insulin receptor substrate 1-B isoform X3 [Crassostrea gigas]
MMENFDSEDDNISRASSNRWSVMAFELPGSDILKTGYLKKLKTKKDKFFVLRSTSSSGPARLEYHDSEKKFKAGQLPKRQIHLHKCFNINKKSDTRQKNCIALYLVDECFAVIVKDAAEMQVWLDLMLEHQYEYLTDEQLPYPHYDYIWQVEIKPKGLGVSKHLCGGYRFCLQDTVCFVRNNSDKVDFEIQMMNIRRCGHKESFFFMELGRHSPTGSGELWMQVDDTHIAQTMHEVLLSAMREPFRSRSNTSSSGRIRDAEIESIESRSREGSHGQSSLRNKKKKVPRPGSALSPEIPPIMPQISTSPSSTHKVTSDSFRERGFSNSMEQQKARHDSFTNKKPEIYGSSPGGDLTIVKHLDVKTPNSLETTNSYLVMSPTQRSVSPLRDPQERSGSSASEHEPMPKMETGYMDMKPGSVGSGGASTDPGYIDMSLSTPPADKGAISQMNSGYIPMGTGHAVRLTASAPIPIRQPKEPGYMEMGPSSQPLPQIKEGGSGEAYLPMTPSANSPLPGTDTLRPAKMICYLSDDSMSGDLPKRSFSLGSRPNTKTMRHHTSHVEPKTKEEATDNGRWLSAPHLIAQKKAQASHSYMNSESSLASSPCQSLFSEDSMMEMEYRPRATSESYRPRTSSVGKILSQSRQRSSSYGQQSKLAQLAHDVRRKVGSFESVRNSAIDKQLFHRSSNDSIGHLSFSSKASSSESLRLSSRNSEYVDMHLDKSNDTGYIDMSIGTPKSTKSSACHSRSSSNQSLSSSPAIVNSFGIKQEPIHNVKIIKSSDGNSQKSSSLNVSSRSSIASKSPCGSGRESEDESYVPYAPGISGDSQGQESRSGSMSDKKTSSRSNSLSSDRRPGSRSGSFGSEKNPDSRSNSFGSRPGPRSGSFKADPKTHKSSRLGRHSPKTSLVSPEAQKSGDRKAAKQSDDNQYIDYEPGSVDIYVKTHNPQAGSKDGECNTTIVSRSTVQKPNAQVPQYSMSTDPLFSAMLSLKQKGVESEKSESEMVKNSEANSQGKEDTTQPKTMSSESYSYMEYAPDTSITVDSTFKSPEVARSYFSHEASSKEENENKAPKNIAEKEDQTGSPKLPSSSQPESANDGEGRKRKTSRKESGEAVVRQVMPMKTVLLDNSEEDDGYVGLDFGDNKRGTDSQHLSRPPLRVNITEGTSVDGDLYMRQNSRQKYSPVNNGAKFNSVTPQTGMKKKTSTSSLQDQDTLFKEDKKETEKSCESLNLKSPIPLSVTSSQELQKQNSMPCMAMESDPCNNIKREEDLINRRSCSDLASEYEEMSLPAKGSKSGSTQQLSNEPALNYAKLDLGSCEEIPADQRPRQTLHPSSPDETGPPVQGYAEIDFEMSDNLKNARSKEKQPVKFSIE